MNDPGETVKAPKGKLHQNSQAKGPDWDETLESRMAPKKQALWVNLSGYGQRCADIQRASVFYVPDSIYGLEEKVWKRKPLV
jgi:hypothetical protein